jgi:hypothetical protein
LSRSSVEAAATTNQLDFLESKLYLCQVCTTPSDPSYRCRHNQTQKSGEAVDFYIPIGTILVELQDCPNTKEKHEGELALVVVMLQQCQTIEP